MKHTFTKLLALSFLMMAQLQVYAQTTYRVNAFHVMNYDGTQFVRAGDSTRAYFLGTHSFADLFGEDIPQFLIKMFSSELYLPVYPEDFSRVSFNCDSLLSYDLNGSGTAFDVLNAKVTSTLDAKGNITELLFRELIAGTWENDTKETYTYNSDGQITEYIFQDWASGSWKNSEREVSIYNSAKKLQEFSRLRWTAGSWDNSENYLYEYDLSGNCTQSIRREPSGSSWTNSEKNTITYDASNHPLVYVYEEWVGGTWKPSNKASLSYSSRGDILTLLTEDYVGGTWENNYRATYSYSGSQKTECLQESYDGGVWNKKLKTMYNYSASKLLENMILQNWDNPNSVWKNEYRLNMAYNGQNLISNIYNEEWNAGDFWEKTTGSSKYNFFYESYDGGNTGWDKVTQNPVVTIYPNPTAAILNVQIDWRTPQSKVSTLTIYDITGRICMMQDLEKTNQLQTQINVSHLPAGSYYLKISTSTGQLSKVFQLVK